MTKTALITGSAGFIGFHLCELLLEMGFEVIGVDAITEYYDPKLKLDRLKLLEENSNFVNYKVRVENFTSLSEIFEKYSLDFVVHLAAQAGVRYSIEAPEDYVQTNLVGTYNVLELSKRSEVNHLLMASTSSVYGSNKILPFHELQKADTPMSFYAATKKSNELMAHSYAHIFALPITVFRFFTVYGPWGRPDMALFKFIKAMTNNEEIEVYNYGKMQRDFTYVIDLVKAIERLTKVTPPKLNERENIIQSSFDSLSEVAPFRIVNIGNSNPVELMDYIQALENSLGIKAKKSMKPIQPGDVPATFADTKLLKDLIISYHNPS